MAPGPDANCHDHGPVGRLAPQAPVSRNDDIRELGNALAIRTRCRLGRQSYRGLTRSYLHRRPDESLLVDAVAVIFKRNDFAIDDSAFLASEFRTLERTPTSVNIGQIAGNKKDGLSPLLRIFTIKIELGLLSYGRCVLSFHYTYSSSIVVEDADEILQSPGAEV
jgi:hypothetical protein